MSLPLDTPIRLKPEFASVYSLAPAGALAYARRRKIDEGFPMIFVEWDKSHWSYSGENDKWTFEGHFEPIDKEKSNVGLPPELQQGIEELFAQYAKSQENVEGGSQAKAPESALFDLDTPEEYKELAARASEAAAQGAAFVLFGVQATEHEGERVYVPYVVQSYSDEVAGLFLETQLDEFTSSAFRNAAVELIRRIRRDDEGTESAPDTEV